MGVRVAEGAAEGSRCIDLVNLSRCLLSWGDGICERPRRIGPTLNLSPWPVARAALDLGLACFHILKR